MHLVIGCQVLMVAWESLLTSYGLIYSPTPFALVHLEQELHNKVCAFAAAFKNLSRSSCRLAGTSICLLRFKAMCACILAVMDKLNEAYFIEFMSPFVCSPIMWAVWTCMMAPSWPDVFLIIQLCLTAATAGHKLLPERNSSSLK